MNAELDEIARIVHDTRWLDYERNHEDGTPPVYAWLGIQDESERLSYEIAEAIIEHWAAPLINAL